MVDNKCFAEAIKLENTLNERIGQVADGRIDGRVREEYHCGGRETAGLGEVINHRATGE